MNILNLWRWFYIKRYIVLLLSCVLLLSGCKKEESVDEQVVYTPPIIEPQTLSLSDVEVTSVSGQSISLNDRVISLSSDNTECYVTEVLYNNGNPLKPIMLDNPDTYISHASNCGEFNNTIVAWKKIYSKHYVAVYSKSMSYEDFVVNFPRIIYEENVLDFGLALE